MESPTSLDVSKAIDGNVSPNLKSQFYKLWHQMHTRKKGMFGHHIGEQIVIKNLDAFVVNEKTHEIRAIAGFEFTLRRGKCCCTDAVSNDVRCHLYVYLDRYGQC